MSDYCCDAPFIGKPLSGFSCNRCWHECPFGVFATVRLPTFSLGTGLRIMPEQQMFDGSNMSFTTSIFFAYTFYTPMQLFLQFVYHIVV